VVVHVTRDGSGSGSVSGNSAGNGGGNGAGNSGAIACGALCGNQFMPGSTVTLDAVADAGSVFTGWLGACTGRGPCQFGAQPDSWVLATFAPATIAPLRYDIDGNNAYDSLTDGLLVVRYLFGLAGQPMIAGAVGGGSSRTTAPAVQQYLDDIRPLLDIDGSRRVDALTDGLLLMRYLFGLRGSALIAGAIDPAATRTTAGAIESYIASLLP
jgi:hypothetical protein